MGIEPTYSAWKAEVLPLNYTRVNYKAANDPHLILAEILWASSANTLAPPRYPLPCDPSLFGQAFD